MQLGSEAAKIPLPTAGPGQSHAGRPGKFGFCCSKRHRLAYYLFFTSNLVLLEEFLYTFELVK